MRRSCRRIRNLKKEANILYISTAWPCYFCLFLASPPPKIHPPVSCSQRCLSLSLSLSLSPSLYPSHIASQRLKVLVVVNVWEQLTKSIDWHVRVEARHLSYTKSISSPRRKNTRFGGGKSPTGVHLVSEASLRWPHISNPPPLNPQSP